MSEPLSNPFLLPTSEHTEGNPFDYNDDDSFLEVTHSNSNGLPPTIQVEEKQQMNGYKSIDEPPQTYTIPSYTPLDEKPQTYTCLDEEQQKVESIMRSVSMDEESIEMPSLSESVDLHVKVDSPEKHVEGYVSYCVTTQTTRKDFELNEYKVRRRYQDFLWMRQKLEESNPTHIIPPLPEKFTFSKHITDKYDQDFLKTRQKALDKFLARIVDHPVMSFNESFRIFLTAKAWEMTVARKKQGGSIARVSGNVRSSAAQLMMKNRDEEFNEMGQYNTAFQQKIKGVIIVADQIAQERYNLLDDYAEYATAFRLWSNSELKLSDTLNTVAYSLDKNSSSLKAIIRAHESRICEPLREYMLYCDSVKTALKRRDQIQIEHDLSTEELQKRRQEKEEIETTHQGKSIQAFFGKDPERVKEEKLEKVTQQIEDLISESEAHSDRRATADQDIKADMERWQKSKRKDMKTIFLEMAERHIKFYESNIDAWQESLENFKKPRVVHNIAE